MNRATIILSCLALAVSVVSLCAAFVATATPDPSTVLAVPPLFIDGPTRAPTSTKPVHTHASPAGVDSAKPVARAIATLAARELVDPSNMLALIPALLDAAEREGVDPILLVAIAWHESRFNVTATSPDGCDCGVMQVRSSTCIEGRPTCAELLDPVTCIDEAARILADRGLVSYTGGSAQSALERLTTAWEVTR